MRHQHKHDQTVAVTQQQIVLRYPDRILVSHTNAKTHSISRRTYRNEKSAPGTIACVTVSSRAQSRRRRGNRGKQCCVYLFSTLSPSHGGYRLCIEALPHPGRRFCPAKGQHVTILRKTSCPRMCCQEKRHISTTIHDALPRRGL